MLIFILLFCLFTFFVSYSEFVYIYISQKIYLTYLISFMFDDFLWLDPAPQHCLYLHTYNYNLGTEFRIRISCIIMRIRIQVRHRLVFDSVKHIVAKVPAFILLTSVAEPDPTIKSHQT